MLPLLVSRSNWRGMAYISWYVVVWMKLHSAHQKIMVNVHEQNIYLQRATRLNCRSNGPRQANLVLIAYASSEGSGETARMRRLAWTFAARIGDKYQIRLAWPIYKLLLELFHERCSLYKWWYSLDKWYRQAAHTQFSCDFLVVFERAVDLRMKIALHTFISIKDVCLHRTPFSHLLITRKNIPSGENTICQNRQVKVTKIIAANIISHTDFAVST